MTDTVQLVNFSGAYFSRLLLAAVRVLAAIGINPLLGSARVPLPGRIGLGLFITLVLFPPGGPGANEPVAIGPGEIAGELLVGLLAGFAVTLIFATVQFAASLIGVQGGFGFGATIDPHADLGQKTLEQFFTTFAMVIFLQINGHHLFLAGLYELFGAVPLGGATLAGGTVEQLTALTAALFGAAVKMALPVIAALLLADLGLAVLARVAPQLNLFAIGLPAKILIGLGALVVALPVILPRLEALIHALPQAMLSLAG
ncbi:MAG TPA: flagellar biosynthetic protein FliR [Chloroflexota bacterium]|nr:flagellar biosynthetic protein FliR [Chloroflexota bacterium]